MMKKIYNLISKIIVSIIFMLAILAVIITFLLPVASTKQKSIFGYYALIVKTDSMKATDFAAGDLIFVKEVKPSVLQEGDIIAFQSQNKENYGEFVTHKIRKVLTLNNGKIGFMTYGATTNTDDGDIVTEDFVLGKYQGKIPKIGYFFSFLKTVPGYIVCILIPFLCLIFYQSVKCIQVYEKYKTQQLTELETEKELMKQEIENLKRQLSEEKQKNN